MGPVRPNPIQITVSLFTCVCIALCTIVAHNIAQNRPDSFSTYPPDNHHCSDDVYLREGVDWKQQSQHRHTSHDNHQGHFAPVSKPTISFAKSKDTTEPVLALVTEISHIEKLLFLICYSKLHDVNIIQHIFFLQKLQTDISNLTNVHFSKSKAKTTELHQSTMSTQDWTRYLTSIWSKTRLKSTSLGG